MAIKHVVQISFPYFYIKATSIESSSSRTVIKYGLVIDASPEAAKWNVVNGITKRLAERRCPGLVCVDFNPDDVQELYHNAWSTISEFTPLVEPTDFHKGFIDLTGCLKGQKIENFIQHIQVKIVIATGIHFQWGGGQDKWMAALAEGKDAFIYPDKESQLLQSLSVDRLNLPQELQIKLERFGIHTVGALMNTPKSFLQSHLRLSPKQINEFFVRKPQPVKATYPLKSVEVYVDIEGADEVEFHTAIQSLCMKAANELKFYEIGQIELVFHKHSSKERFTQKFSKHVSSEQLIKDAIYKMMPLQKIDRLHRITLHLKDLSLLRHPQTDLWTNKMNTQLETVCEKMKKKYKTEIIHKGSDLEKIYPPRFAQLIYRQRGMFLP